MSIPINKVLYEKAKLIADNTYKTNSAYKSGFLVKTYKDMGGKYKGEKDESSDLNRWFNEKWEDVNPLKTKFSYPVYRPTKIIDENTPLTVQEIDPINLLKQSIIKQKIKGDKNLQPFKGAGVKDNINMWSNPETAQKKAYDYLGKDAKLYKSDKKDKKYKIFDGKKWVHFGQMGYEDFTKHQDNERRNRYLKRTENMKGNWKKNPYSPNNLSRNILW
jgi:hypothetical protein